MKRVAALVLAAATLAVGVAAAAASWTVGGSGTASARATSLGSGNTPTATAAGRKVNISWAATSFTDGTSATGYTVRRYANATGGSAVASIACASTTCADNPVPPGTWYYGVTPSYGGWTGSEGSRGGVTVGSPSLALSPTTFTSLPQTLSGTVANFIDGETLTFRLDSATTGTVLEATGTTVNAGGSNPVSVTMPTGTASGAHTVYAAGSQEGTVSPASVSVTYSPQASLTLSPTTITTFPATLSGAVNNFGSGETVDFRLDNATTGSVLATASADTSGSASNVSMTLTCASNATHTVYAVSATHSTSATVTVSGTFCPLTVSLNNRTGGTPGLAEPGDAIVVEYNGTLDTTSLCASFSVSPFSGATVRITDGPTVDDVSVDGPSTGNGKCTMNFGSISLGNGGFNASSKDVKFDASLAWDSTVNRLTITLGAGCGTGSCGTSVMVSETTTARYTPGGTLKTAGPNPITISSTTAKNAVQF